MKRTERGGEEGEREGVVTMAGLSVQAMKALAEIHSLR